ncbi:MAG: hypothetical protein ABEI27_09020 [Halobellus sp.]|uniref:hypothetical protein n=1 Tax=Halobellus sp. TaxID=1979212 RepID=UPI0035D477BC
MPSGLTTLFVLLFVVTMAWVGIASAVAVGVEQGLKRYRGESNRVFQSESEDG